MGLEFEPEKNQNKCAWPSPSRCIFHQWCKFDLFSSLKCLHSMHFTSKHIKTADYLSNSPVFIPDNIIHPSLLFLHSGLRGAGLHSSYQTLTDIRQVASSSQTEYHILNTQTKSNCYLGIQHFLISKDNLKLPGYTTIPGISSFSVLECSPLSLLLYCTLLFPASLSLTIQEKSHEGGSHRKFSQMLAKVGEGRLCRALALTFCQTPLSPPGPLLPPSPLLFGLSFLPAAVELLETGGQ